MNKTCCKCKQQKDLSEFYNKKTASDKKSSWCKSCEKEAVRKYYHSHPKKKHDIAHNHYRNLKNFIIEKYGNKCSCCGETNKLFLTLDHVNNNGGEERRKRTTYTIMRRLRDQKECDPNYQILCFNCNCGKNVTGGECPHKMGCVIINTQKTKGLF